jgi:hypothetical protein
VRKKLSAICVMLCALANRGFGRRIAIGLGTLFETRMKTISRFCLLEQSLLKPDSEFWASGRLKQTNAPSQYSLARTALVETFRIFTPLYVLCFALNDYNGIGGTGRKNDPCYWVAGGHSTWDESLDESISDIFLGVVAECEHRLVHILLGCELFAKRILEFYPSL